METNFKTAVFVRRWRRRVSVSYTHLDVYKRQVYPGRQNRQYHYDGNLPGHRAVYDELGYRVRSGHVGVGTGRHFVPVYAKAVPARHGGGSGERLAVPVRLDILLKIGYGKDTENIIA